MGTLADSLFNVLMGWVRALVNGIWALFTTDHTTLLEFLGKNWIMIVVVILAAGLAIDWLVWLIRWRPYHLWAKRARRFLHLPEPEEEETGRRKKRPETGEATQKMQTVEAPEEDAFEDEEQWLPLQQPQVDERQAQEVLQRAQSVPDEELGAYPGMRYGAQAGERPDMGGTQRYAAIHTEGPGAAEVERRRRVAQKPKTYSDYVSGETVEQLPDPPRWPQVQQAAEEAKKPKKSIMSRMAKMMEDDDDHEIFGINALPPRVSRDEAYRPAKKPTPSGKSKR